VVFSIDYFSVFSVCSVAISIDYFIFLSSCLCAFVANRENALADFGFSRYSVQDSIMHQVGKWGFGAWMCGGICAADSMEV